MFTRHALRVDDALPALMALGACRPRASGPAKP